MNCSRCGQPLEPGKVCKSCHAAKMREWRRRNPARYESTPQVRARATVRRAKARGTLISKPCCICGDPQAEMHHTDHSRPHEITWLCVTHHKAWHRWWGRLVIEKFEEWVAAQHRAMADANPNRENFSTH